MTRRQKNSDGPVGSVRSVFYGHQNWSSKPIPEGEINRRRKDARARKAKYKAELQPIYSTNPALRAEGEGLLRDFPINDLDSVEDWEKRFKAWLEAAAAKA
jgi:hypothetical protein